MKMKRHIAWILLQLASCAVMGNFISNEVCVSLNTNEDSNQVVGNRSPRGERPWVVLLWITCPHHAITTCEGSIIDREWILTAASCIPCGKNASVVVDIGLYHSDIRQEIIENRDVMRLGADMILVHPQYKAQAHSHNLALIHLKMSVDEFRIIPLSECSKTEPLMSNGGKSLLGSGWGRSDIYSTLDVKPMQDVHLYKWSKEGCLAATATAGEVTDDLFCAGVKLYSRANSLIISSSIRSNEHREEPCYVNHGSSVVMQAPRVLNNANKSVQITCEWQLCGVLSYGLHCGPNGLPGYYIDMCAYQTWLHETIKQEKERLMNLKGCPTVPLPPVNGFICGLDGVSSGQVQFCCERGYRLKGTRIVTCDRNEGRWLPIAEAVCEPVTCAPLPTPSHGLSHPPNCLGSSYTMACWFSCDNGYQLQGQGLLTCQEDGTWSDLLPNCEPIDCGPPPAGGNLLVEYTKTIYESVALYKCKTCQKLSTGNSSLQRQCNENGYWSGPLPVCQMVHCPALSSPEYGHIVQSSTACGSQVRYHCMDGFVLLGADVAICLTDEKWSQPAPFCVSAKCPTPIVEDSINFLPPTVDNPPRRNFTYGDQITIQCQECRRPVGGSTNLTCTERGQWSSDPPMCEWVTCILPKLLPNGQIFPLGNVYFCGTLVRFRCYPGYQLVGVPSTYCSQNGTWTHSFPTCKSLNPNKECPQISVNNGRVSITHKGVGGVANVSCDQCYHLSGSAHVLKCTDEGQWDPSPPSCLRQYCSALTPPTNGRIFQEEGQDRKCGNIALFECNEGYTREGPQSVICQPNGQWSRHSPTCQAISCSLPPEPGVNSRICSISYRDNDTTDNDLDWKDSGSGYHSITDSLALLASLPVGSSVQYCCNAEFELERDHSGTLICTVTGDWSGLAPQCSSTTTCELELPHHSTGLTASTTANTTKYRAGSVAHLSCTDGNVLIGNKTLTCLENGNWDSPIPHCINSSCYFVCPPAPVPKHGRLVSVNNNSFSQQGGISEGTVAIYTCSRRYFIHGSIIRRCTGYGQWSGETTLCLKTLTPRSKFILRHPVTKQWIHADNWHYTSKQSVYLACQSISGKVSHVVKMGGPPLDPVNVRVSHFSMGNRSQELLLQPINEFGARSIAGDYLCRVTKNQDVVDRIIHVYVHDYMCQTPSPVANGNIIMSGLTPGSCYIVNCNRGYRLYGNGYRTCQSNGKWSGIKPQCKK